MNKIYLIATVISILSFGICCKKEEVQKPVFNINDIIGKWERVGGELYVECPSGVKAILEITSEEIIEMGIEENGCPLPDITISLVYNFKQGNLLETPVGKYIVKKIEGNHMAMSMTNPYDIFNMVDIELMKKTE